MPSHTTRTMWRFVLGPASAVVPLGNAAKATKRNFLNRSFNARASVEEHELSSRVRAGLAVFFPARDGAVRVTFRNAGPGFGVGLIACQQRTRWNKVRSRERWILQQRQSAARNRTQIFGEAFATKSAALPQSHDRAGLSRGEKRWHADSFAQIRPASFAHDQTRPWDIATGNPNRSAPRSVRGTVARHGRLPFNENPLRHSVWKTYH